MDEMVTTTKTDKLVAANMLAQLGGYRFMIMTGTQPQMCGPGWATFKLKRNQSGANVLKITLTPADVYEVEFISVRGLKRTTMAFYENVYNSQLQNIFTEVTGFYTY